MTNSLEVIQENEPWYKDGLKFSCTGCGKCCTGSPGYVWVTTEEICEMADTLKLHLDDFVSKYVREIDGRYSLNEMNKTFDCVFLENNKCKIYHARPKQCRTFPWWPHHLQSKEDWIEASRYCEGIQETASIVPLPIIQEQLLIQIGK